MCYTGNCHGIRQDTTQSFFQGEPMGKNTNRLSTDLNRFASLALAVGGRSPRTLNDHPGGAGTDRGKPRVSIGLS